MSLQNAVLSNNLTTDVLLQNVEEVASSPACAWSCKGSERIKKLHGMLGINCCSLVLLHMKRKRHLSE